MIYFKVVLDFSLLKFSETLQMSLMDSTHPPPPYIRQQIMAMSRIVLTSVSCETSRKTMIKCRNNYRREQSLENLNFVRKSSTKYKKIVHKAYSKYKQQ